MLDKKIQSNLDIKGVLYPPMTGKQILQLKIPYFIIILLAPKLKKEQL